MAALIVFEMGMSLKALTFTLNLRLIRLRREFIMARAQTLFVQF